jgi:hypothetical protein
MPDPDPTPDQLIELLTQAQYYVPRNQLWHEIEAVRVRRDRQETAGLLFNAQAARPNQVPFRER